VLVLTSNVVWFSYYKWFYTNDDQFGPQDTLWTPLPGALRSHDGGSTWETASGVLLSTVIYATPLGNDLTVDGDTYTVIFGTSYDTVTLLNAGVIDDEGALTANVEFNLHQGLVSANLSGTSALNKLGAGQTVVLTGSNSYTGLTSVLSGTLVLSGSASIASANVEVSGTGSFVLDLVKDSSFSSNIAIADGGALVLGGTNTHDFESDIIPSGVTLNGVISGSGDVFVHGDNWETWYTLTGENTSTGSYGVERGYLQIGDGTTGSISAAATVYTEDSGYLVLNLADGGIFANDVDNKGGVAVIASGTNIITGDIFTTGTDSKGEFFQAGTGTSILLGNNSYEGDASDW
jgi:autotransporter-associated beta strand protein